MNGVAVEVLARGLGLTQPPRRRRDLSGLAGGWSAREFEQFRRATAVFEAIAYDRHFTQVPGLICRQP